MPYFKWLLCIIELRYNNFLFFLLHLSFFLTIHAVVIQNSFKILGRVKKRLDPYSYFRPDPDPYKANKDPQHCPKRANYLKLPEILQTSIKILTCILSNPSPTSDQQLLYIQLNPLNSLYPILQIFLAHTAGQKSVLVAQWTSFNPPRRT